MNNEKVIYLAGGCFWGTEHFLKLVDGVTDTCVGYANSCVENPTYEQVCGGTTQAAETVRVAYDAARVDLDTLLGLYFKTIDPTSVDRQGGDCGRQYRTGIYYVDAADVPVIEAAMARLAAAYDRPLAVEVLPLQNFYAAEGYHQDYLDKHPDGYCHLAPELFALARATHRGK